jgi:hypothetical protein
MLLFFCFLFGEIYSLSLKLILNSQSLLIFIVRFFLMEILLVVLVFILQVLFHFIEVIRL